MPLAWPFSPYGIGDRPIAESAVSLSAVKSATDFCFSQPHSGS